MLGLFDSAFSILLIGLGMSFQGHGAELKGARTILCSRDNTRCLRVQSYRSSQSQFANIFTFKEAVVEQLKGPSAGQIQMGTVTLDLVQQKLTIFQRLGVRTAKEIQFDLKTLDQKEFLVD